MFQTLGEVHQGISHKGEPDMKLWAEAEIPPTHSSHPWDGAVRPFPAWIPLLPSQLVFLPPGTGAALGASLCSSDKWGHGSAILKGLSKHQLRCCGGGGTRPQHGLSPGTDKHQGLPVRNAESMDKHAPAYQTWPPAA